jgi:hypothetical protein
MRFWGTFVLIAVFCLVLHNFFPNHVHPGETHAPTTTNEKIQMALHSDDRKWKSLITHAVAFYSFPILLSLNSPLFASRSFTEKSPPPLVVRSYVQSLLSRGILHPKCPTA